MSKFPPKPPTGHLWDGKIKGRPLYLAAPIFFELGRWIGQPHAEASYFQHNDVLRLTTDYALDMKRRCWVPFPALSMARGVKNLCAECVNDPERCICINRFFAFLENGFKPFPVQQDLFAKEVAA